MEKMQLHILKMWIKRHSIKEQRPAIPILICNLERNGLKSFLTPENKVGESEACAGRNIYQN